MALFKGIGTQFAVVVDTPISSNQHEQSLPEKQKQPNTTPKDTSPQHQPSPQNQPPTNDPPSTNSDTSKPTVNNDINALFEMIGELTENTKSISSVTNLIPSLQADFRSKILVITSNCSGG